MTSILHVTAVANSVQNQQDQTWNFIQRGVWTLIEANLGTICTFLTAVRQLENCLFLFISSASKTGSTGGYWYGYGSSKATCNTNRSVRRDPSGFINRQHSNLDDAFDGEDNRTYVCVQGCKNGDESVWAGGKSYQMTSRSYRGASDDGCKSDEEHIVSVRGTERNHS